MTEMNLGTCPFPDCPDPGRSRSTTRRRCLRRELSGGWVVLRRKGGGVNAVEMAQYTGRLAHEDVHRARDPREDRAADPGMMERLGLLSDGPTTLLDAAKAASWHNERSTMSTQAPEQGQPEIEVVTGQVMHVIVKGEGKWQIAVQPQGSQYTKNLWTKDAGLVQQMEASINHHFSFVCGPSYWNMADGKQVRSLWINSVTTPGQAQEQTVIQQPVIQGAQQVVS